MRIRQIDGEKLREYLKENEKNVEWLATHLGRSVALTRNILNGYTPAKDFETYVERISKATGISEDDLVVTLTGAA